MSTHNLDTTSAAVRSRPSMTALERILVGLEFFLAIGAFFGAWGLLAGAIDLGESAADLPFGSVAFGAVALAVIVGALPSVVAIGALRRSGWSRPGHLVVGAALMGWIGVQVAFIGLGSWVQVAYFAYGAAILIMAARLNSPRHAPR